MRAIAAHTLASRQPQSAAATIRRLGSRADATTIAPLALTAWPDLARETIADPSTRTWSLAVTLIGRRLDELIAIATTRNDPGRLAAVAALGRLGGDAATQTLTAIHSDASEDDAIKLAAWKALRRIARGTAKTYAEGQDKGPRGTGAAGGGAGGGDDESVDDDGDDGDDGGDGDGDDGEGEDAEEVSEADDSDDDDSDDDDSDEEDSDDDDSDDDEDDDGGDDDDD
ncbi:MAG TPA: hypothetical protein VGD80_25750 [Kofleriaceae bacterium]